MILLNPYVLFGIGPLSLIAPAITGTLSNGSTLTSTTGTWSGSPSSYTYQWKRDGVNIAGQTSSTYTYVSATDDGTYLSCAVTAINGSYTSIASSNVLISDTSSVIYTTSFVAADGTQLQSFPGWEGVNSTGATTLTSLRVLNNDLNVYVNNDGNLYRRDTGTNNHAIKLKVSRNAGDDTLSSIRYLVARNSGTNFRNMLTLTIQSNGWILNKVINNVNTGVSTFASRALVDGDEFELVVNGDYVQVWLNGTHTALSAAQNGGLGWNVSDVPVGSYAGVRSGALLSGAQTTFPFKWGTDLEIKQVLTNSIQINSIVSESITQPFGPQRIRLTGVTTGSVTQLQALVLSSTGQVLVDWHDVVGLSGNAFNSVTTAIPESAEGTTVTVWIRDKIIKSVSKSGILAMAYQPVVAPMVIGINENTFGFYERGPSVNWINNGSYSAVIAQRGSVPASGGGIPSSSDGLNGTVLRGWDGSIGSNSLGITTYGMVYNPRITAAETGSWTIKFPPGTTVVHNAGATGWSYNSGTGIGTYSWPISGSVTLDLRVNVATLTAAGPALISLKQTSVGSAIIDTRAATNVSQLASSVRVLDVLRINNDEMFPERTALAHPSRQISQRPQVVGNRREDVVAHLNAAGASLYYNVKLFDSDALIEDDANYYLQNLNSSNINISFSNEMWNFLFKQTTDIREAGVRAGFAPIGVTDPSMATPETVYSTQYPTVTVTGSGTTRNTTVAYADGEKFIYNGFNGVQVYQAIGNQSVGAPFQATTNANFSLIYNNTDTSRAGDRWVAYKLKRIREIWDARAAFYGKPRPNYWVEGQAGGGFSSVQKYLDQFNLHQYIDGVSAAHYWGGGVAVPDPFVFTNSMTGFTLADKELLYTTADQTTAINTLKDKFFAIAISGLIDPVGQDVKAWKTAITNYAIGKGYTKDRYKFGQYEMNHHLVSSGWPDTASAWSSSTTYSAGNYVKDGGKIFKCILGHTNQITTNATYWTELASVAVTAENRRDLFYISVINDSRFYDAMLYYYNMMKVYGGGIQHHYTRINYQAANGSWGVMLDEEDTTNVKFLALKDFKASL